MVETTSSIHLNIEMIVQGIMDKVACTFLLTFDWFLALVIDKCTLFLRFPFYVCFVVFLMHACSECGSIFV